MHAMRGAFHAFVGADAVNYLGPLQDGERDAFQSLRRRSARVVVGTVACIVCLVSEPLNSSTAGPAPAAMYTRHDRGKALRLDLGWSGNAAAVQRHGAPAASGITLRLGDQMTHYSRILLDHNLAEQPLYLAAAKSARPSAE